LIFLIRPFSFLKASQKSLFFLCALICISFLSQAQNMFYHLLPGFIAPFTWVGLGSNSNWTTVENWSTGVVPGAGQVAIFDDNCIGAACAVTINTSISVAGFQIKSSYIGSITQATGQTVVIGASGWTQNGGTFLGGDSNITMNGAFVLSGGAFTATAGTWTQAGNMTISGAPTFNHNNGNWTTNNGISITPNGITLNNATFSGGNQTQNLNAGTLVVAGNLTLSDTNSSPTGAISNGTIEVLGDVASTNFGKTGTATIVFKGSSAQSLSGSVGHYFPSLRVDKPGGILTMTGTISTVGIWTWLQGTVDASGSTLVLLSGGLITPGPVDYNNVTFGGGNQTQDLNTGTMKVLGTLSLSDTNSSPTGGITNGTIEAAGNIVATNYGKVGTGTILIKGLGAQSLTGLASGFFPSISINKVSGTLTVNSTIAPQGPWTWLAGTVDASASTLVLSTTATHTPGPLIYNNVTFSGGNQSQNLNAGTMSVAGVLTFADTNSSPIGSVNNGTINATGNVIFSSFGKNGSINLNYTGNANSTLTVGASAATLATTHNVAKTGLTVSLSLVNSASFSSAGRNFTVSSGTFNLAGFALTVNSLLTVSSGARLLCNGGTATAGSWSLIGEISCGSGQGITWTGASGDNLWSTAGNWTNNTVPSVTDAAIFNAAICVAANCNAQINSNLSVRGITLQSSYVGTLTQNSTRTLTVGTAGYNQSGGIFVGGDVAITINGPYILSGGTFTATSSTWTQAANLTISGAPTFNHNGGLLTTSSAITISANGNTFNNVTFAGSAATQNLNAGTMIVIGTLTFADTSSSSTGSISNGTIEARGDVVLTNGTYGKVGTGLIKINGTGAQSLIGNAGTGKAPVIEIDKPSGTLTISNSIIARAGWIYTTGTVDASTSTITFDASITITPGSMVYNNVTFAGTAATQNLNAGTMIVIGTLTFADGSSSSTGSISNGTIEARGDVVLTSGTYGKVGTGLIKINGTGAQSLIGNVGSGKIPVLEIDKPSGTLTISNTVIVRVGWIYTSGTVDAGSSTLYIDAAVTITPGSMIYNNVTFAGSAATQNLNAGTMIVIGTLTFADTSSSSTGSISNGTIEARGDVVLTNGTYGKVGAGLIKISGTGAQSLTGNTGTGKAPVIEIDKPSGTLTISNSIIARAGWIYTTGAVDAGTSTLIFDVSLTITPGSMVYNNVTFAGTAMSQNLNTGTMIVAGTLTFADGSSISTGSISNGTIEARGDVVVSSGGKKGTANLILNGISTGTLTWTAGSLLASTLSVEKTGGASVVLNTDALFSTAGRNLTVASGTLDLNGYDLNVNSTLTIDVGAILKCNGGEIINPQPSSLVNNGIINCPGFSTYDFNWTGSGGNSNWNTAGNWQIGTVPTPTDLAYFNPTYCGANCDVVLNVDPNARGILTSATYNGTITQASGVTVTLGRRGWVQAGGTFVGSDANMALDGGLSLSAGAFTMTSATTTVGTQTCGTRTMLNYSGGTLAHNNGRFKIAHRRPVGQSCHAIANMTFPNGFTVYDLETQADSAGGWNNTMTPLNGTLMNVLRNFYDYGHTVNFDIDLAGDLFVNKSNPTSTTRQIRLMGAGTQEYTFNPASIVANKIKIEKATGSVQASLGNTEFGAFAFELAQGSFVAPTGTLSVGTEISSTMTTNLFTVAMGTTFSHSNGTTKFNFSRCSGCSSSATGIITVPAGFNFYNVEVTAQPTISTWVATNSSGGSTLNVLNNFIHYGTRLNSLWTVQGHVTIGPNTYGGTGTITLNGTGAQSITAYPGSFASEGNWIINKPSGTVTMYGSGLSLLATGQDFLLQAGSLNLNGALLNVKDQFTVASGATVTCNNGFYTAGSVVNAGTINCADNYVKSIITDGPKAYWRLAEPSSSYLIGDSAFNGTYKGTSMASGDISYAIDRVTSSLTDKSLSTATNGYVDLTTPVPLAATYTIESWFKYPLQANGSWNTLLRGASDHQVIVNRTNMQLGMYDNTTLTSFRSTGFVMSTLAAGWHHLVVIGSGTTMNFYVDSVNVGSVPLKSSDPVRYIGNINTGGQSFGNIDDIAIYDFALSVPQITDHYNKGKP
jgi:hypothetical protein